MYMDFKKKYLKYKKKYLELKNQLGGWSVKDVLPGKNSIRINDLPSGTTLDHLVNFLKSKCYPSILSISSLLSASLNIVNKDPNEINLDTVTY